jgi:hypothetical protein
MVSGITAALLFAAGCNRASDERERAVDAQTEANKEVAEARNDADRRIRSAQAEADEEVAKANANFQKIREEYRHDTTQKLVELDKEIQELEAKALKSNGKERADLETRLKDIRVRREAFVNDYKSIETASADTWDATKARLDKQWTELKDMVDRAA